MLIASLSWPKPRSLGPVPGRSVERLGFENTKAGSGVQTDVLTCHRTRQRISAYLDGALDPDTARSTAAHLDTCARCNAEADAFERLHTALQAMRRPADPDWVGFWPGVVRGIEDSRPRAGAPRRSIQPRLRWAVGSALAAALLVSLTIWQVAPWQSLSEPGTPTIVRSADTEAPNGNVMVYSTPERDLTVVWVLGLADTSSRP